MKETWKTIPIIPRYSASSLGAIKCTVSGKLVKQHIKSTGYPVVNLCLPGGGVKQFMSHRLICMAFHGVPPAGRNDTSHEDGTRNNNRASNLSWKSRRDNSLDMIRHGTCPIGQDHHRAILKTIEVRAIRALLKRKTMTLADIGRKYKVSSGAIASIKYGKSWKRVK